MKSGSQRRGRLTINLTIAFLVVFTVLQLRWVFQLHPLKDGPVLINVIDENGVSHVYGRHSPLVLISGFPYGGAALLKQMLENESSSAAQQIVCGAETEIVEAMLQWDEHLTNSSREDYIEMAAAGLPDPLIHDAFAALFLQIWIQEPKPMPNLTSLRFCFCHHDSLALMYGTQLKKIFPNVKALLVTRDPDSILEELKVKGVQPYGLNLSRPDAGLKKIERMQREMKKQCELLGTGSCFRVEYDELGQNGGPQAKSKSMTIRHVLAFLDL